MTSDTQNLIAAAIDESEEIQDPAVDEARDQKPRLLIENCDPHRTVSALRDILSEAGGLYDRGAPVRLAFDQIQGGTVAQVMTPDALVMAAHTVCRPYVQNELKDGTIVEADARLSRTFAVMYLDWRGEWRLPPLNGIASAPLLEDDGVIHSAQGYDQASGMWRENVPDLTGLVPEQPAVDDAAAALRLIRETFKTFCFADAETVGDAASGLGLVDTRKLPGKDESGFLAALLTAICRPSLHLAPGVLLRAAPRAGAGAGKGLLARCISIIAFGREPHAVTRGASAEELDKRIAAELIEGSPVLFLDNLNNTAFRSNLLASAITERPAQVRVLGRSQMVPLNASAFVILTGNGLSVSEDLARRFIAVDFDPRTEDPEARTFATEIRIEVTERRTELLAALLTIWRWGQIAQGIAPGRTLGSFEQWCRWVRDPLLALGCKDPADRVSEAKERDGRRQVIAELFAVWWERHHDRPIAIRDLDDEVKHVVDPQGRGRQYLSSQLEKLAGTRMAGFVLTRQAPAGKWGAATYALVKTGGQEGHRDHRGHSAEEPPRTRPEAPYAPDADGTACTNSDDAGRTSVRRPLCPLCLRRPQINRPRRKRTALAGGSVYECGRNDPHGRGERHTARGRRRRSDSRRRPRAAGLRGERDQAPQGRDHRTTRTTRRQVDGGGLAGLLRRACRHRRVRWRAIAGRGRSHRLRVLCRRVAQPPSGTFRPRSLYLVREDRSGWPCHRSLRNRNPWPHLVASRVLERLARGQARKSATGAGAPWVQSVDHRIGKSQQGNWNAVSPLGRYSGSMSALNLVRSASPPRADVPGVVSDFRDW